MTDHRTSTSTLRAIAHPVRLQMLSLLTGTDMSAAEVARELGITHANASYHLRLLADAGELVIASEEKIRGGVAKRYRHPWDAAKQPRTPPTRADRRLYIRAVAEELVRRFQRKKPRTKAALTDAEMWVEPEVWVEILDHLATASQLVHDKARPPHSEGTIHVNVTTMAFQMRDDR